MAMIGRREFCRALAVSAACAPFLLPGRAGATSTLANRSQADPRPSQRLAPLLWVSREGQEARIDYSTEEGYKAIAWMLRDVRAGVIGVPHGLLLDQWAWMQAWLAAYGYHVRFDILSGLRTPATNSTTEGAAQASYHLPNPQGVFKAGDFTTASIPSEYLGRLALLSRQGGVGFYTRHFIHTDVRGFPISWRAR